MQDQLDFQVTGPVDHLDLEFDYGDDCITEDMENNNNPVFAGSTIRNMDKDEVSKFLDVEVPLEKYFSPQELTEMGELEQRRYKNMVQNYNIMLQIGLPAIKPDFMKAKTDKGRKGNKRRKPAAKLSSSSDTEDEWTPDIERRKKAKGMPAVMPDLVTQAPVTARPGNKIPAAQFSSSSDSDDEWTPDMEWTTNTKEKRKVPAFMRVPKTQQKPAKVAPKRKSQVHKVKADPVQRESYELRKNRTISFMNLEPPDDDHFLYCEDCNKDYEGDCPMHGPLTYVEDAKVAEGDPDKALHSLPPDLYVKESCIRQAGLGVFTQAEIPSRTMFGPYGGVRMKDPVLAHASGYCWQIYRDGAPSHFVDAQDKAESNWMRYVNCARSEQDQNLVAFQYKGGIYYRSFKPILPGTELLVWYGDEYARELGISKDEDVLVKPVYVNGECCYRCGYCSTSFSSVMYWAKHVKIKHGADKLSQEDTQRINRWLLTNHTACKRLEQGTNHSDKICNEKNSTLSYDYRNGRNCDNNQGGHGSAAAITTNNVPFNQGRNYLDSQNKGGLCNGSKSLTSCCKNQIEVTQSYKCKFCGQVFCDRQRYITHIKKHLEQTRAKYDACKSFFDKKQKSVANNETTVLSHSPDIIEMSCGQNIEMVKHKRIDQADQAFECDVCGKSFSDGSDFFAHKRLHAGEKPYKCEVCGKSFDQISNLVTHKRVHTGEKSYKCEVCGKSFSQNGDLVKHKRLHTEEKPYKCDVCGKSFTHSHHLVTHKRTHTGERPYNCDVCGKSFSQNGDLVKHNRLHTGERPYKCELCGKSFNDYGNLIRHKRLHTGERPYKCEVCGKSFDQSNNLVTHKRLHTGERPYKCEVCGKSFAYKQHLVRHKRLHTGEKPYKCEVCGKTFSDSSAFVRHKRIHTGERPYKCEVCGKSFNQQAPLVTHKRIHTVERPYKCEVCGKSFSVSSSLVKHKRTHTKDKPYK